MLVPIVPVHAKFVKVLCTVSNNSISHNSNTPVGRRFPKLFLGMFVYVSETAVNQKLECQTYRLENEFLRFEI